MNGPIRVAIIRRKNYKNESCDNLKYTLMVISAVILKAPTHENSKINKGAIILSGPDEVCRRIHNLKDYFYIIEWRGWSGMNMAQSADIKLVEDFSTWEQTKLRFPNAILLDLAPADFVDVNRFRPLNIRREYAGIQIARWDPFKRHELFVKGVSLLPMKRFVKFGHFAKGGSLTELTLKRKVIKLARGLGANLDFPYANLDSNSGLPNSHEEINLHINKARMGVITSRIEGVNRFNLECMAANIPVLVPSDTSYPTMKHINKYTGVLFEPNPQCLAESISFVESRYGRFRPREYIMKNTGHENSLKKLADALNKLAIRDRTKPNFDNIYWDGRNQSMVWGENAFVLIESTLNLIKR